MLEANETFTITLSAPSGTAIIEDAEGIGTITNDDSIIEFSLDTSDYENVGKNLPAILVSGTIMNDTNIIITDLFTGTATPGADYNLTSPYIITIPAGVYDGTQNIILSFIILNDEITEENETIDLLISSDTILFGDINNDSIIKKTFKYTILDDDSKIEPVPSLNFYGILFLLFILFLTIQKETKLKQQE